MKCKQHLLVLVLVTAFLTSCNKREIAVTKVTYDTAQKSYESSNSTNYKATGEKFNRKKVSIDSPQITDYKVTSTTFKRQKVAINYPQIIDFKDTHKQQMINDLLKTEALNVLDFYEDFNGLSLEINYRVTWQGQNLLSLQYYGIGESQGAPYPLSYFYTVNVDMKKGCKLRLKDFIKIDKQFVTKFRNYKVKDPATNQASQAAFDDILETSSVEQLLRYFEGADSSYKNSAFTFSYISKDALYISIEVPHEVGDHTEIELKYEEIKNNLRIENEIWQDFASQLV